MGAKSKRKGKRGELEVAAILREAGLRAHRGAPMQSSRNGEAGPPLPDVVVEGSPFWLEVKRGRRVNVRRAMAQALADAPSTSTAVVVHRDDGGEWMATARLEDILEVVTTVLQRSEFVS